jgi:hypothetical protein
MSLVKANTYQDASGGSNAVFSGVASPPSSMGFRNRIINGNMVIDQRNAGASVTEGFAVDRFEFQKSGSATFTVQRNTTAPANFTNSVVVTVTSAASATAAQVNRFFQRIEGNNISDFGWGTANAQTVTVSFRVRSSLTGTYCVALVNGGATRSYVAEYTISAANTWETKTVTITGDTSGTWATDNTSGVQVTFDLGGGSNYNTTAGAWATGNFTRTTNQANFANTSGATFYITGVQLEAGTNASAFEQIDYGRELMMCQRYYAKSYNTSVVPGTVGSFDGAVAIASTGTSAGAAIASFGFPAEMRAPPTMTFYSGNSGASGVWRDSGSSTDKTVIIYLNAGTRGGTVYNTATMSGTAAGLYGHWVAAIEL